MIKINTTFTPITLILQRKNQLHHGHTPSVTASRKWPGVCVWEVSQDGPLARQRIEVLVTRGGLAWLELHVMDNYALYSRFMEWHGFITSQSEMDIHHLFSSTSQRVKVIQCIHETLIIICWIRLAMSEGWRFQRCPAPTHWHAKPHHFSIVFPDLVGICSNLQVGMMASPYTHFCGLISPCLSHLQLLRGASGGVGGSG